MNDYLWDKSGEPDADVQRLEELLGTLRHERRPLELPATILPARAFKSRRPFRAPLAIAAALALAALILLWPLLLRQNSARRDASTARQSAPASLTTPQPTTPPDKTTPEQANQTATTNQTATNQATTTLERRIEQNAGAVVAAKFRERATPHVRAARRAGSFDANRAAGAGRSAPLVAVNPPKVSAPRRFAGEESQPHEAVAATLEEQRLAKEQLMLALRLTSAKLNLVQKRTQGTNDSKTVPDEQNKLR